jgi:site-specific recombinase XerD
MKKKKIPEPPWAPVLEEYDRFLAGHRGLGDSTRDVQCIHVRDFLRWQFGKGEVDWTVVQPRSFWKYAEDLTGRFKPSVANHVLCALRAFLRYIHLRGDCPQSFDLGVPRVANFAATFDPGVLTSAQQRQLLQRCPKRTAEGRRDYAMLCCMLDLGLRRGEVVRLRLNDVCLSEKTITVPPIKGGHPRRLPLPRRVESALRDYLDRGRPTGGSDHVFVLHGKNDGRPVPCSYVNRITERLYRRCGFPANWHGPHRLRHTFATRLFSQGATLKEIADILGHRWVQTSRRYTHVDLEGLRALARPWPL